MVASGFLPGSILGLVLFNSFINYLDTGLRGILSKFADNTELEEVLDSLEILWTDLDKLEGWVMTHSID